MTGERHDPRIGIGAIVIVHHEAHEPDTNGVVASKPDQGFANVLILTGNRKGTISSFDTDLLEPCGWVTGYSSSGWPETDPT